MISNIHRQSFFYKILLCLLFIGIVPLTLSWLFSEAVSRKLLIERSVMETESMARQSGMLLDSMVQEYSAIIDTLSSDTEFQSISIQPGSITPNQTAMLYDKIYFLLAGKNEKPALHLIESEGALSLSTQTRPREYDPIEYGNWGLLRKAPFSPNRDILFAQGMHGKIGNPFSLSIARYLPSAAGKGIYIIIDLMPSHFRYALSPLFGADRLSLLVTTENTIPIYAIGNDMGSIIKSSAFVDFDADSSGNASYINEDDSTVIARFISPTTGLHVFISRTLSEKLIGNAIGRRVFLIAAMIVSFISIVLASFIAKGISRPLYKVIDSVSKVKDGNFSTNIAMHRKDEIGILADSIDSMSAKIESLVDSIKKKERSLRIAELSALQAQIRPHFLFNCLELIKWNALLGKPNEVASTVLQLGRLLRSSMQNNESVVPIWKEWAFIEDYLAIQKSRFQDRLIVALSLDDTIKNVMIPKFLIQPFIENSLVHGLERRMGGGHLDVVIRDTGKSVFFSIVDDGMGMDEITLKSCLKGEALEGAISGIGISNVIARLRLYYGESYDFSIVSNPVEGTTVTIEIPYRIEESL